MNCLKGARAKAKGIHNSPSCANDLDHFKTRGPDDQSMSGTPLTLVAMWIRLMTRRRDVLCKDVGPKFTYLTFQCLSIQRERLVEPTS